MQIYNNLGDNNSQFVTRTTETNKDGIHLLISKSKSISNNGTWKINYNITNDEKEPLGNIVLIHSVEDAENEAEIEYYSNPNFKNKGNLTIALKEVLKDIFSNLSNLDSIYLNIAPSNVASQKVAMNCGFKQKKGSKRYYVISKQDVMNQTTGNNKMTKHDFTKNDSYITNKLSNNVGIREDNINLENLLNSKNELLLIAVINTISNKELLQEWLNKDPRAKYLIYKIDVNKLLQFNLLIPDSILNDNKFPNYLIKTIIDKTESLIDVRSYLYKFQSINFEFYQKSVNEYKKYIQTILNSYDYNTQIFGAYLLDSSFDRYLLPKILRDELKNLPEEQKINILKRETSLRISEIVIDSIFEDNIYNVRLNLNEIIRYTNDIDNNLISSDHLDFYKTILKIDSLSNEYKINLYNNYKDKNISSILYDDQILYSKMMIYLNNMG